MTLKRISEQYSINQQLKDEVNDMLLKRRVPLELEFIKQLEELPLDDILKLTEYLV
jgi:hypothetical protein